MPEIPSRDKRPPSVNMLEAVILIGVNTAGFLRTNGAFMADVNRRIGEVLFILEPRLSRPRRGTQGDATVRKPVVLVQL